MLVGRSAESARIDGLLNGVRGGTGGALMLLGEPGIGKSALLQYAERQATDMRQLAIVGVAAEAALPYAGLSELLRPVLWGLEALPGRQSRASKLALGAGEDGATDAPAGRAVRRVAGAGPRPAVASRRPRSGSCGGTGRPRRL